MASDAPTRVMRTGAGTSWVKLRAFLETRILGQLIDGFQCLKLCVAEPLTFAHARAAAEWVLVWLAFPGGVCSSASLTSRCPWELPMRSTFRLLASSSEIETSAQSDDPTPVSPESGSVKLLGGTNAAV